MESIKRIPPNSLEAEQSIIGSILIDADAIVASSGIITSKDFYQPDLKAIYEIMLNLYKANKPIELVSIGEAIKVGGLESHISIHDIFKLTMRVSTSIHIESYAKIVKEKAYLRQAITYAHEIAAKAYEQNFESTIGIIGNAPSIHLNQHMHQITSVLLQANLDDVAKRYAGEDDSRGMRTGFVDLDNKTGGIKAGELIGLYAGSNVGKSIIGIDIAKHIAREYGKVAFFAYETQASHITYRMLADEMRVEVDTFNRPKKYMTKEKFTTIKNYKPTKIDNIEIFAEELVLKTAQEVESKIRLIDNLQLIVIDYLHKMNTTERYDNDSNKFTAIERELHALCSRYGVPILLLMGQTKGKDGVASFRGTGELKHDVDQLWVLQRDMESEQKEERERALLTIEKGRDNGKGKIKLWYQEDYLTFKSVER